jgi:hypothetical protein
MALRPALTRSALALLAAATGCHLPDTTLVAYDGPRRPPAEVALVDEEMRREGFDIIGRGSTDILELDGRPVDPPYTLELLPGQHVLLVDADWEEPSAAGVRGQARPQFTAEAGHHYIVRAQRTDLVKLLVLVVDMEDGHVAGWAPAG